MTSPSSPVATSQRWLYGPVTDLLVGCGLYYVIVFAVSSLAGAAIRPANEALYLLPLLILVCGGSHYGGTILRVYERRSDRRAYVLFSVYATIALCGFFVWGLYNSIVASCLLTVYLTWSPWHYTGQNYGIAVMFLRRRGVQISKVERRWLYSTFVFSWILVFVVAHESTGSAADIMIDYASVEGPDIYFIPFGIPAVLARILVPTVGLVYVVNLIGIAAALLKRAPLKDLIPTFAIMFTQALWFSIPLVLRHFSVSTGLEPLDWGFRRHYFLWIVCGHAIQLMWIASYFARESPGWKGYSRYFGKTIAAGMAVWVLPVVVFGPHITGRLSVGGGLYLLVAAAVNLHHFILDGVIWKLRHSRVSNVLISRTEVPEPSAEAGEGSSWVRRLVWSAACVGLVVGLLEFGSFRYVYESAFKRGDYTQASAILDRLAWVGHDRSNSRMRLATRLAREGNIDEAVRNMERSVELRPLAEGYFRLGAIQEYDDQRLDDALMNYDKALEIDPNHVNALKAAGGLALRLDRPREARAYLERAEILQPDDERVRAVLERAETRLENDTRRRN
jgi:Tfp pilus assembly protein PilF